MMRGKITVIVLASIIIWVLLFTLFYFTPLFAFSFGGEPEWYIVVIAFLRNAPFTVGKAGEVNTFLVFINALFWTLCVAGLLYSVARGISKKSTL
ncbi:hypothetical protein [Litoribacter populi]|uniref:hypothetical protein n=1 Tax=Litoribacter populi TaxID=2598460 RepID=UPI0011812AFA|nr:hypothetical protein [Litoribacter populi]